ncbi:MAG: response regulator [Deltaproteobacteria bacterium]|nr:response regulator [Deltaproteobacteria bacterium]
MTPTILIIDDCADIANISARYLQSAGYRTIIATSAFQACEILGRATPDCIVLDIMMPGMTGTEFLHGLRNDPICRDLPVVLVSARVGYHGTHFSTTLDADYSVGKPFTCQQLVQAVRTVIAKKAGAARREASAPPH